MTNILIVGAGTVGTSVAEALDEEGYDLTIIDQNESALNQASQNLDVQTILGNAADPVILEETNPEEMDMVLAVTDNDSTNIMVCLLMYRLGLEPHLVARVRNMEFHKRKDEFFGNEGKKIPIHAIISPAQRVTDQIMRLIRMPGALQVVEFAGGKIQLVAIRADEGGKLVDHKIEELGDHMPGVEVRVAAIYRAGQPIIPKGDTVIRPGDEVFFIAVPENLEDMMQELRAIDKSAGKRVMLVGAGNIGMRVAAELESLDYRTKLVEYDFSRAEQAATELDRGIVIHGNATDQNMMIREGIEMTEVFCSVTNDDAVNILSAMMAKWLGARRTMALINNSSYVEMLEAIGSGIDIVISPNQNTIGELLRYIRSGLTVEVHSLRRGVAEAIETVAVGDKNTSKVVGRRIEQLKLPQGAVVGAILRDGEVLIAHHDLEIQADDHTIIFVAAKSPKLITQVQRLFEPDPLFFS